MEEVIFALVPQSRPQSPSASNMAAEGANLVVFGSLLCSRDLDKKMAVFRRLLLLGWWTKIARIFLSARKLCRSFLVWKRSKFSYASYACYFSCVTV